MKILVLALSCLSGCLLPAPDVGDLQPGAAATDAGDAQGFACDNSDSDPQIDVSFSRDLRPLMLRVPGGCFPCHLSRTTSGLDVSSYALFRRGGMNTGTNIIIDFDPCNSILLKKIGRTPPFGSRMPLAPPQFTDAEQLLFRDWIAEGARNN